MDRFVSEAKPEMWSLIYLKYDKALLLKASKMKPEKKKDLLTLDKWYQMELQDVVESRKPKHITRDEICKLMKWKLTRGKFRPRLTELVQTNSEDEVRDASTKAFQALPDVSAAVQALTVLKAVGPATASAVLAAGAPGKAAFMADESMQALPGLQPIKYDLTFYQTYMKQVTALVKQLNKQDDTKCWTPHKVELTLWTYHILRTLEPGTLHTLEEEASHSEDSTVPPRKKKKT